MSYAYQNERAALFTEEGQRWVLAIRDRAFALLDVSGAVSMHKLLLVHGGPPCSWTALACVDRLVEIGDLREITGTTTWGQHRVFVAARARPSFEVTP